MSGLVSKLKCGAAFCVFVIVANCGGGGSSTPTPTPTSTSTSTPAPVTADISVTLSSNLPFRIDSDINSIRSSFVRNNTAASAQSVENNSFILGYVSKTIPVDENGAPEGQLGNSSSTDEFDYYKANLLAGEILRLEIAQEETANPSRDTVDPASGVDLDLELLDLSDNSLLISNSSTQAREEIIVPNDGEFLIKVIASSGSSKYALTLGGSQLAGASVSQINPAHVAIGKAVVSADQKKILAATHVGRNSKFSQMNAGARVEIDYSEFLASNISTQNSIGSKNKTTRHQRQRATLDAIKAINLKEGLTVLEPYVFPRKVQIGPPSNFDPSASPSTQWNLSQVEWDEARLTLAGLSVSHTPVIAVIDSGFLTSHPDIADSIIDQRDFVEAEYDGDGFDAEAEEIVDPNDENADLCHDFHGTHVASIALASINNQGMMGVYPEAKLMALKVGYSKSIGPDGEDSEGENCETLPGDIASAIRYAAQLPVSGVPLAPVKADVINLSLGSNSPSSATRSAINAATAAGVIVIGAGGNEGGTSLGKSPFYPAAYDNVFAVAASNIDEKQAYYSSEYAEIDLTAPGGDVRVDSNNDDNSDGIIGANATLESGAFVDSLALYQGSSMAAPHVAGAIAMMRAIDPTLNTSQLQSMMKSGVLTVEAEDEGFDFKTGYGIISLPRMINAAQGNGHLNAVTTRISANPKEIDIEFSNGNGELEISKIGDDALSVSSVIDLTSPDWLTVTASSNVDADGIGTYNLVADTTGLTQAVYESTIRISLSDASMIDIAVTLLKSPTLPSAPAPIYPNLYALLQQDIGDGEGFNTIEDGQLVSATGPNPQFNFTDVEVGEGYLIVVASDLDGDGFICSDGEICGYYPDFDRPSQSFELEDDVNFDVEMSYLGRAGPIGPSSASASEKLAGLQADGLTLQEK